MPKAYSLDLRERIARFVKGGRSCHAAAAHFGVSISFAVRLMATYRKSGSLAARPSGGRRHAKLDPHRQCLLAWVSEQSDITMPELAGKLAAATGAKADPASLSRWLIRNGHRFKKNAAGQRTRSRRRTKGARGVGFSSPTQNAA